MSAYFRRSVCAAFVIAAMASGCRPSASDPAGDGAASQVTSTGGPSAGPAQDAPGFLYGRVATHGGAVYEGRLRWGGDEEAFWSDYFNGYKEENPWAVHAPIPARTPVLFGIEWPGGADRVETGRPFMARFGDLRHIRSVGDGMRGVVQDGMAFAPTVRVTLKSGTAFDLDRLEASDFDDGVRVWDEARGVVDLAPAQILQIDFLPTPPLRGAPGRLHGTVETRHGVFSGFLQWDRTDAAASDELAGLAEDVPVGVPFGSIRSIARHPGGGSAVTRRDGSGIVLAGTRQTDEGNRGLYVDDVRYGRVLVSWDAFERVTFNAAGSGLAYPDFPPGRALAGHVRTRAGRRLAGRLVFDLDESETTETLDAPSGGVDYTIPFGLVASITLPSAEREPVGVRLRSGETLALERAGDLSAKNGGLLVFEDEQRPEYLPWSEVEAVEFEASAPLEPGDAATE